MVKINTKKEMNLIELINWGFENDVHCKSYITSDEDGNVSEVTFDACGIPRFSSMVSKEDIFTVEIEEEITEETIIFRLLEVRNTIPSKKKEWQDLKLLKSHLYGNRSISRVKNEHSVAFYNLNDDMTTTLIWKDGELVGDE